MNTNIEEASMAGAVPNRQGGRRRRNTTDANGRQYKPDTITVGAVDWDEEEAAGRLVPAPEPDPGWHAVALSLYNSMRHSGQRIYYEPSDWAVAVLVCNQVSRELNPKFIQMQKVQDGETSTGLPVTIDEPYFETVPLAGGSLSSIMKALEQLMVTEVARRTARIEIERGAAIEEDIPDNVYSMRAQALAGGA